MAVACPKCESSDLELVEITDDGRRRIRCESCEHVWVRGKPEAVPQRPKLSSADTRPVVFDGRDGYGDDAYLHWAHSHPSGYVLNCERVPRANYLILHRTDCYTITEAGPRATTWTDHDYIKVCATDRQQLRQWASDRTGSAPTSCGLCM